MMVPRRRSAMASARADLPLAVGPATIRAVGRGGSRSWSFARAGHSLAWGRARCQVSARHDLYTDCRRPARGDKPDPGPAQPDPQRGSRRAAGGSVAGRGGGYPAVRAARPDGAADGAWRETDRCDRDARRGAGGRHCWSLTWTAPSSPARRWTNWPDLPASARRSPPSPAVR